jgi:hypothetical protein
MRVYRSKKEKAAQGKRAALFIFAAYEIQKAMLSDVSNEYFLL